MKQKKDIKPKVAIIRGKFLNQYEMQSFYPLKAKYDITLFGSLSPFQKEYPFNTQFLPSPMDIPNFPFKMPILNRLFTDAHYLFDLEKKLKGFDIAHSAETYYRYTQQALDAKKSGNVRKVLVTVLENIPFNNEGIWGRREFKQRVRAEADHFIALTERTKSAMIAEGTNPEKITVISHGIDTKRFFPSDKKFNKNHIKVLFTGRLEEYKGVFDILFAAKLIKDDKDLDDYKINFVFLGEGSKKQEMLDLEKRLNLIKNVDHISVTYDKVPDIYRNSDIFIAPSKSDKFWVEQYNTSLLEAQASGLPIITTYSGGIPENVGNAAVLVGPGDSYSIYLELKDFILHPIKREKFATLARRRALEKHDINIIAGQIDKVYKSLL